MSIVHHADVRAFDQVLVLPGLTGILTFMASLLNVPVANVS